MHGCVILHGENNSYKDNCEKDTDSKQINWRIIL